MEPTDHLYASLLQELNDKSPEAFKTPGGEVAVLYSNRSTNPVVNIKINEEESQRDRGHQQINRLHALDLSNEHESRYCIDRTEAGKWLESEKVFDKVKEHNLTDDQATKLWERASERFVENAQGNVETFGVGSPEDRIFRRIEIEAALKNEKITSINNIPKDQLLAEPDPLKRYEMIVDAELERDAGRSAKWMATLEHRIPSHEKFMEAERARVQQNETVRDVSQLQTREIASLDIDGQGRENNKQLPEKAKPDVPEPERRIEVKDLKESEQLRQQDRATEEPKRDTMSAADARKAFNQAMAGDQVEREARAQEKAEQDRQQRLEMANGRGR